MRRRCSLLLVRREFRAARTEVRVGRRQKVVEYKCFEPLGACDSRSVVAIGSCLGDAFCEKLSAKMGAKVVAPELLTWGSVTLEDQALVVAATLEAEEIDDVVVVGHRYGGTVGARLAANIAAQALLIDPNYVTLIETLDPLQTHAIRDSMRYLQAPDFDIFDDSTTSDSERASILLSAGPRCQADFDNLRACPFKHHLLLSPNPSDRARPIFKAMADILPHWNFQVSTLPAPLKFTDATLDHIHHCLITTRPKQHHDDDDRHHHHPE